MKLFNIELKHWWLRWHWRPDVGRTFCVTFHLNDIYITIHFTPFLTCSLLFFVSRSRCFVSFSSHNTTIHDYCVAIMVRLKPYRAQPNYIRIYSHGTSQYIPYTSMYNLKTELKSILRAKCKMIGKSTEKVKEKKMSKKKFKNRLNSSLNIQIM